ncbi:MAG: 50S ribosomal protein L15 [Chloroflexota bacterium]|nr:50S ribosomal protein L15 [Chloroflexota bacterium]
MMQHQIKSGTGSRKARKRIGRGNSAGGGTYAGRGLKGQKSRSGKGLKPGFEGGQNPLIKGLPMIRGFNNKFKTHYSLVPIGALDQFPNGERITPEYLYISGITRNKKNPIKILGDGNLTKPLNISAHKFTESARNKIEAVGGTIEEL